MFKYINFIYIMTCYVYENVKSFVKKKQMCQNNMSKTTLICAAVGNVSCTHKHSNGIKILFRKHKCPQYLALKY